MKYLIFLLWIATLAFGQDEAFRKKHFLIENGLALSGYDPVSYFSKKPKRGSIHYVYNGVKYAFTTVENIEKFKAKPQAFEPAYGGWCAYAMGAKNEKVDVDPLNFKIVNGRLMLFYKNVFKNTLDQWNENEKPLNLKADQNWNKLK